MAVYRLGEHTPQIDPSAWIADSADVIGQVTIGALTNIWYGSVIRADNDRVVIGARTSVQEGCSLHTDAGILLSIGDGCTVGHQAMLHGCTIGESCLIGIQAVVLNHAVIGPRSLVGAGALVTEGKRFPEGSLIVGRPAKVARALTPAEIAHLAWAAEHYVKQAERHRATAVRIA